MASADQDVAGGSGSTPSSFGELPEGITQSESVSTAPSVIGDADVFLPSGLNVRAEEVGLVFLVLLLWAGAVALFFNRWGKIRMLEPYQPKFIDAPRGSLSNATAITNNAPHRPSFPLIELNHQQHRVHSRLNMSTWCDVAPSGNSEFSVPPGRPRSSSIFTPSSLQVYRDEINRYGYSNRPRLNSVTVLAASHFLTSARRVKSAVDIQTLVLKEEAEEALTSFSPSETAGKDISETAVLVTSV